MNITLCKLIYTYIYIVINVIIFSLYFNLNCLMITNIIYYFIIQLHIKYDCKKYIILTGTRSLITNIVVV